MMGDETCRLKGDAKNEHKLQRKMSFCLRDEKQKTGNVIFMENRRRLLLWRELISSPLMRDMEVIAIDQRLM